MAATTRLPLVAVPQKSSRLLDLAPVRHCCITRLAPLLNVRHRMHARALPDAHALQVQSAINETLACTPCPSLH